MPSHLSLLRASVALFLGGLAAFAQESFTIRTFNLVPDGTNPAIPANLAVLGDDNAAAGSWSQAITSNAITYEGLEIADPGATSHGRLMFTYSPARDFGAYDRIEVTAAALPGNKLNPLTLELRSTDANGTVRRSVWYRDATQLTRHGDKITFPLGAPGWSQNNLVVDRARVHTVIVGGDRSRPAQDARLIVRDIRAVNDTLLDPAFFPPDRILGYNSWYASRVPQNGRLVIGSPAVALNNASLYVRYVNASPEVKDERDLTPYTTFTVTATALPGNEADLRLELRSIGGGASHWILPRANFATESTVTFDLRAPAGANQVNLSRISGISLSALGNNADLDVRWSIGAIRLAPANPAVFTYRRGLNISHWMAQLNNTFPNFADTTRFNDTHLDHIASLTRGAGGAPAFDHIRIPVAHDQAGQWNTLVNPPTYTLKPAFTSAFSNILLQARARGLGVILDLHTLPGLAMGEAVAHPLFAGSTNPVKSAAAYQAEAETVWRAMARQFANEGPWLRFELMNEPRYARRLTTEPNVGKISYEPMHSRAIAKSQEALRRVIRETNPTRTIYVTTNNLGSMFMFFGPQRSQPGYGDGNNDWGVFSTGSVADPYYGWDKNIAYTIHYYEPNRLTHYELPDNADNPHMSQSELTAILSETGSLRANFANLRDDITRLESDSVPPVPNNYLREYREIHIGEFGTTKDSGYAHAWSYSASNPNRFTGFKDVREHFMHRVRTEAEEHGFAWCAWDYLDDDFATFDTRKVNGVVVLDAAGDPVREPNNAGAALIAPPPAPAP